MIQLGIISVFVVMEIMFVLCLACVLLWFKYKNEKNKNTGVVAAEPELAIAEVEQEAPLDMPYEACLRSEIKQLQDMVSSMPEAADDADEEDAGIMNERQLLEMRQEFLVLELMAQDWVSEADMHREKLMEGMRSLVERCSVNITSDVEGSSESLGVNTAEYDEQLEHFKSVIDNQLNVMRDLREKLSELEGADEEPSADIKDMLAKLVAAEEQAKELNRCVAMLEEENQRLHKSMASSGAESSAEINASADIHEDVSGMETLVSNQQVTIGRLKGLLDNLALEAAQAQELEGLIETINSANKELTSCIMVLEDENTMLRGEMERLRSTLSTILMADSGGADGDGELQATNESLTKKMDNLKSMIDIKDTTIGELQQKVESLKSEYMTATGKMPDIGEEE